MANENNSQKNAGNDNKKNVTTGAGIFPLGKINFILMAVCLVLIILGFLLMIGSSNTGSTFNYDIFASRRTVVGPFIAFIGFILMAFAIIYKGKDKKNDDNENKD
jgi:uncharacterized membrane protein